MEHRLIGIAGLAFLLGTAYLLSSDRKAIRLKTILWGIALQVILALIILRTPPGQLFFAKLSQGVSLLLLYADKGSEFVFGDLARPDSFGFVFAFKVLPIIIFISSFFTILYYLGIMQKIVLIMARVMTRLMGVSGAESLAAAANVFMGQTEAPIIIAPYIPHMTYSELMALMTGGMATVSGAVLASYVALGIKASYLLAASVMAAPASLVMAKLLVPEIETPKTAGRVTLVVERRDVNIIDAAARGASQGVVLALNVGGMLVAFIALIALVNGLLGFIGTLFSSLSRFVTFNVVWLGGIGLAHVAAMRRQAMAATRAKLIALLLALQAVLIIIFLVKGPFTVDLTLQKIFSVIFAPIAFLMGVPAQDVVTVGKLLGTKLVLNEFVAYVDMSQILKGPGLTPKGELIATYALCGFANFSSIGIQLGGIGGLAPERRQDLARLGLRALLAGSFASFMTATIAGILS